MISSMKPDALLPGVEALLIELRRKGIGSALGSASKNAQLILGKTAVGDFFDVVVDVNMVTRSKPDPKVFLTGAEKLRVSPADCVVFEDAAAGVAAAKRAGMKQVVIGHPNELNAADWLVQNFAGLTGTTLIKLLL